MMIEKTGQLIRSHFPYEPTGEQQALIHQLAGFIQNPELSTLFLLKGYAGTGKTTIVSSLVKMLPLLKAKSVLLAPTGRAAKVLAGYSGQQAFTIHKKIYRLQAAKDGSLHIALQPNKHRNTFFIVDEASMISGGTQTEQSSLFGGTNLLDDLVQYVVNGNNCRLLLIGDTAQLPPVKTTLSPALSENYLKQRYHFQVLAFELTEVVRQARDSGILLNATRLREMISHEKKGFPGFHVEGQPDFIRLDGQDAADEVNNAFMGSGTDQALIICRSNKRANLFNKHIRSRVLFMEDEINAGDLLMVVKNNYFWLPDNSAAGFIANGDIIEIKRINRIESLYGFRFADLTITMIDYPEQPDVDLKIMLDTLDVEGPALGQTALRNLFEAIAEDYQDVPNQRTRMEKIRNNPHFNALQVKFAYAMTCHKAQGGQWENVFVEMGFIPGKMPDTEYLRWLYTAITRATKKLFLLNFTDDFFTA